jgi:hypothetical protein
MIVAELRLRYQAPWSKGLHHTSTAELEYFKEMVAREIWNKVFGGMSRDLSELINFVLRHGSPNMDWNIFNDLVDRLQGRLQYKYPPKQCPQKNHQPETPETFSTPPTVPEKEANPDQSILQSIEKTSTPSTGVAVNESNKDVKCS